ncbi:dihydroxyacetone kinase family protein [Pseudonocardia nematodicida]|uniref:Dihydroxyacetone kinase family protein n=1 Tax=Pseudonocardia nematodicida TaxID=1206997 RepID=A0ABV1KGH1_9PSEU
MTRLHNEPSAFADELVDGFVAAHRHRVRRVPGGVVRADGAEPGTVAVVTGGGSGHYPAFAGLVGPGLADGAATGNVFASPSARQVHDVARAAERGGGILLTYGNYTGDVLQFGLAEQRLRAEGFDCATVTVTDDISSAGPDERDRRRGVAGGLVVYKAAGAASAAGRPFADVVEVATRANDRTRSFGVAFGGCTLPGSAEPLFDVPAGRMALGMGIHGEPGFAEQPMPTADELAALLVEKVLAEAPADAGDRVTVLLNGLGTVKYEELFVVYRKVDELLAARGLQLIAPEVGELVTSFDMPGASLTLAWLDDDLAELWCAPADAPAYCRGRRSVTPAPVAPPAPAADTGDAVLPPAGEGSRTAAHEVAGLLDAARATIDTHAAELGRIDAVAGDGDHGIGMQRGATAAAEAARETAARGAGAGSTLAAAADAWADRAGGTSGALWGVLLRAIADELGDDERPGAARLAGGLAAGADRVVALGGARRGDKTMVDALLPCTEAFSAAVGSGSGLPTAWASAAAAARQAADATAQLTPRLGRARSHGDAGVGTPDAGAVSTALIAEALRDRESAR